MYSQIHAIGESSVVQSFIKPDAESESDFSFRVASVIPVFVLGFLSKDGWGVTGSMFM